MCRNLMLFLRAQTKFDYFVSNKVEIDGQDFSLVRIVDTLSIQFSQFFKWALRTLGADAYQIFV